MLLFHITRLKQRIRIGKKGLLQGDNKENNLTYYRLIEHERLGKTVNNLAEI
jgi:hypothetical protein